MKIRPPLCALVFALVSSLSLVARPAFGQKVLLVADDDPVGTGVLGTAFTGAGMTVTQTAVPSWKYDGTNPAPAGFDVIVLLAGTTASRANDMPAGGQTAIANFVGGGGGLVDTEWSAFQVASGRWQILKPLVLLSRTSGTIGQIDYKVDPAFQMHPLWAGLPPSFSVSMASNVGAAIPGPGVVRIATSNAAGDGVVVRDLINTGRIAQLSSAGNYTNGTWSNANLQTLMVNAAKWASKSRVNLPPMPDPGGPYAVDEGDTVQLTGSCPDPDMDAQMLTWDFTGGMTFMSAMGPNPVFSANGLAGPSTVTVTLKCTDSGGLSATKSVAITIRNVAPTFTSMPPLTATEGTLYTYAATASDPGANDLLTCSIVGPLGMTVQASSCKVQWLPTYDQARMQKQPVTLTITDKAGASTNQSWVIATSVIDTDMDGLPDTWEQMFFGNLGQGPGDDPDKDGRPNLKEYQDGTDPTKYDGPDAPTVMSPDKGVHAPTSPMLVIGNAKEPNNDPLTYEFQVYGDAQLQNIIDVNIGVPQGQMGTTTYVPGNKLAEDRHFWWRARARDPYVAGAWSQVATFFADDVHEPPSAPVPTMPIDLAKVKAVRPVLVVMNARSSDELALTYSFEIYGDPNLSMLADGQSGVAEGKGSTSWTVTKDLDPYHHYFWRARATDAMQLDGPWSQVVQFQIVPTNSPPSEPIIASPREGDRLPTLVPVIALGGSIDPDEEPIKYLCELDVGIGFDTPKRQDSGAMLPDMTNQVTWTPDALVENQHYCVRCRAQDTSGTSGWSQTCFLVDVKNDPPSVPVLQNPSDGGMAAGDVVRFTWINSIDPEGDAIHYDVEIFNDAALGNRVLSGTAEDGPTGLTLVGVPAGTLSWRARAVDALGAASDWSKPNKFVDRDTTPAPLMDPNCGCELGRARTRFPSSGESGALLLTLLGLCAFGRRRRG